MRASRNAVLVALVLILIGTVVPVSAGQIRSSVNPNVELYWRYQSPKPRPVSDGFEPGQFPGAAPVRFEATDAHRLTPCLPVSTRGCSRWSGLEFVLAALESFWLSLPGFPFVW